MHTHMPRLNKASRKSGLEPNMYFFAKATGKECSEVFESGSL